MTGTLIAMCHRSVYQGRVDEARGWTSGIQGMVRNPYRMDKQQQQVQDSDLFFVINHVN